MPLTSAYDLTFTTHDKACTDAVTTWIKGASWHLTWRVLPVLCCPVRAHHHLS